MLAARNLVAVDDFMNMIAMGVNVGVHKFFATPRNLAPFAYTRNKLFLSRPELAPSYRHAFEQMVMANRIEPLGAKGLVEQTLWGKSLEVLPGMAYRRSPDLDHRMRGGRRGINTRRRERGNDLLSKKRETKRATLR